MPMHLDSRKIGLDSPPFVIAEVSGNHNQSLDRALQIVEAAAASGAHAVKLQTYLPETMTIDVEVDEFRISDSNSLWSGRNLFDLYREAHTPWEWHGTIFEHCRKLGVIPFSTPFDGSAVDFLESLECPFYKIASFENIDIPLIRRVARTGKPMIISTGMASLAELDEAVRAARSEGNEQLVLLKCTSSYPAPPENSDLRTIPHLRDSFSCEVGLSDHTLGIGVAVASVALGATVIEKHFTLNRHDGGVDSAFSMEPHELSSLVEETERAWLSLGTVHYGPTSGDENSLVFRRSIYVVKDIKEGEKLTSDNIRVIRPGLGLPPRMLENVLGRTVGVDVERGTALRMDHLA